MDNKPSSGRYPPPHILFRITWNIHPFSNIQPELELGWTGDYAPVKTWKYYKWENKKNVTNVKHENSIKWKTNLKQENMEDVKRKRNMKYKRKCKSTK